MASSRIDAARHQIIQSLGISLSDRLIFTSGGTEANNLAVVGLSGNSMQRDPDRQPNIVVSAIEHPSVMAMAEYQQSRGWEVRYLPVDRHGRVEVQSLAGLIDQRTRLVSLMLVNNETGVIQPVAEAASICAEQKIPFHCDAVQAVGKIPVHFGDLARFGVTAITIAAHKLHGPRGIGALVVKGQQPPLTPLLFGGFQQFGQRPGTEDVALSVGFAEAVRISVAGLKEHSSGIQSMRDSFESEIRQAIPDVVINGSASLRAPHCSNLAFPGDSQRPMVDRQALMMACDMAGVAISTGSACASGSSDPSPVLQAMGLESKLIDSSIRVSFSRLNEVADCQLATRRIVKAVQHLRQSKSPGN
jgi:cysteine desulfurase